jgi:hypothetical protein
MRTTPSPGSARLNPSGTSSAIPRPGASGGQPRKNLRLSPAIPTPAAAMTRTGIVKRHRQRRRQLRPPMLVSCLGCSRCGGPSAPGPLSLQKLPCHASRKRRNKWPAGRCPPAGRSPQSCQQPHRAFPCRR